ncbi:hypothetical protein CDL60_23925 [Roseateles noduli]|nr:hypothetical protein CDL60_23925 [Roseateles noduli]
MSRTPAMAGAPLRSATSLRSGQGVNATVPMRILQDRRGRPIPPRPTQGRQSPTRMLPVIAERTRRGLLHVGDLPAPPPLPTPTPTPKPTPTPTPTPTLTPTSGVRPGKAVAGAPTIERRAQDGLARAMAQIEAELAAPRKFSDKVRGVLHRLGAGLDKLLCQCLGARVR